MKLKIFAILLTIIALGACNSYCDIDFTPGNDVAGDSTIGGDLTISGSASVGVSVTVGDDLTAGGTVSFNTATLSNTTIDNTLDVATFAEIADVRITDGDIRNTAGTLQLYSADELVIAANFISSPLILNGSEVRIGLNWLAFSIPLRHYGNYNSLARYAEFNESSDVYALTRQDSNINNFYVGMPVVINAPESGDTVTFVSNNSITFALDQSGNNLIVNIKDAAGTAKQAVIALD